MVDLDKLEKDLLTIQAKLFFIWKKQLTFTWVLFKAVAWYLFTLWVYLGIYDSFGWERTLIALGVGFIVFSLRNNVKSECDERGRNSKGNN